MIGFFPEPYPDELFYSICARFQERVGYWSSKTAIQEILGTNSYTVAVALPAKLNHLLQNLPLGHSYTDKNLLNQHTLLPFFRPFLAPERVSKLEKSMCEEDARSLQLTSGFMASSSTRWSEWLRFCPLCAREYKSRYGERYWHRLHQLPGIEVCYIHKVFLENSKIRARGRRKSYELVSAEEAVKEVDGRPLDLSLLSHKFLLEIASDAAWLLKQTSLVAGVESVRKRQLYLLEKIGLASYVGKVRVYALSEKFRNYYPSDLLKILKSDFDAQNQNNWLFRLLRHSTKQSPPLYNLLLIHFLGYTAQEFFNLPEEPDIFGEKPWPCLNKASSHFKKLLIQKYKITNNLEKGKVTATFSCPDCGFIYSRVGPDKSPDDQFRFSRVKQYGPVWETALRECWDDPTLKLDQLVERLGMCRLTIKHQAMKLGLLFPRAGPTFRVVQITSRDLQALPKRTF